MQNSIRVSPKRVYCAYCRKVSYQATICQDCASILAEYPDKLMKTDFYSYLSKILPKFHYVVIKVNENPVYTFSLQDKHIMVELLQLLETSLDLVTWDYEITQDHNDQTRITLNNYIDFYFMSNDKFMKSPYWETHQTKFDKATL